MRQNISSLLKTASEFKTIEQRASFLKQNESFALKTILQYNFDTRLVSLLPVGAPPFKRTEGQEAQAYQGAFFTEARKLGTFVQKNPPDALSRARREMLFIQLLESLPGEDADVLIAAKDKKLTTLYKGITEKVVRQAFPEILP